MTRLPRLIGIAGKAGSGKDTLADQLVRQHSYVKYSLAAPMKKMLNDLFGWTDDNWRDRDWKEKHSIRAGYVPDGYGKMMAKTWLSPRQIAQWLGTEVGRKLAGPDVWVNLMLEEWRSLQCHLDYARPRADGGFEYNYIARMVVPDIRFDNEALRIREHGGVIIRINRPDVSQVAAHVSEKGLSAELVNVEVSNDTDIITFLRNATYALEDCAVTP